jgi:GT2 family glycosyltransferase
MGAERTPAVAVDLSVSIVVFRPSLEELADTLRSLGVAAERAREAGALGRVELWLVDNGGAIAAGLEDTLAAALSRFAPWLSVQVLSSHGNVGYGRGHNLAITRAGAGYHLLLNPDVILEADALAEGLRYLESHSEVGLIAPRVYDTMGGRQYLCKRYPSVMVLALRGFGPASLRRRFGRMLDRYEMRDLPDDAPTSPIPIASGCFMLCRRQALAAIGGFSPEYFLYFEDFDLSLRFARQAAIAYVPAVRIRHAGGDAAGKGWAHRGMFIRSAFTFFRRHGWRLW